jgi:integrase
MARPEPCAVAEGVEAMSVRIRPFRGGGWEVDIRLRLPTGEWHRERRVVKHFSKSAAKRWGEDRERHLLKEGPAPIQKEVPTVAEFKETFLDYAKTEREKPSTVAAKESIVRCHLIPVIGGLRLDAITSRHVHAVKRSLDNRKPKTVNNVLVVLKAMVRVAIDLGVLSGSPCRISLLEVPKREMAFYNHEEFERVLAAADTAEGRLVILLGGEAGLRCGEIIALEWTDIDLQTRQMSVARSDWEGTVTDTKGGRVRYVGLTERLASELKAYRHLRGPRVLYRQDRQPMTQKAIAYLAGRASHRAGVNKHGVHILRHTFCSRLACHNAPMKAIQELAGHADLSTTMRYMHLSPASRDGAIRLLERGDRLETGSRAAVTC